MKLKAAGRVMLLLALCITAQAQDAPKTKRLRVLPVPAFGYSPETRTYVGAVALFTFNWNKDTTSRTSNAKTKFTYTINRQIIFENEWNYFFREEKWFTRGRLNYSKYPDLYYGIGANTPGQNELRFDSNRFLGEIYLLKNIGSKVFTGFNVRYTDYSSVRYEADGPYYKELRSGAAAAIGYSVTKDSRNSLLTPERGVYLNAAVSGNFASQNYMKLGFDVRHYKTWKNRLTLSSRLVNNFTFGTPAFYDYEFLGGDKYVRGYYFGRYRDNNLSSWQEELRCRVVWRLGLSVFGGLSAIYSSLDRVDAQDLKYNYGMGLRFCMDKKEKTNLRLDYAVGQDGNNGFYVVFGESF